MVVSQLVNGEMFDDFPHRELLYVANSREVLMPAKTMIVVSCLSGPASSSTQAHP